MIEFEWDKDKAAANYSKHGVTFEHATHAFQDLFGVEWVDDTTPYGGERFILLGRANEQVLSVVYTERDRRIRLISARMATRYERGGHCGRGR